MAAQSSLGVILLLAMSQQIIAAPIDMLILSKDCELMRNTSAAIVAESVLLEAHTLELDCVSTAFEFHQRKARYPYSFFLSDVLETACLDANQGVVPLATVTNTGQAELGFGRLHFDGSLCCRDGTAVSGCQHLDTISSR